MNGILAKIVAHKKHELEQAKSAISLDELAHRAAGLPPTLDFAEALSGNGCSLIAEVKTASPSRGVIRDDVDPVEVAKIYEEYGASCISVLTDEHFFGGSLERLKRIRAISNLPLLRKDFIIDVYQLFEARVAGADAVLLIAACLDDRQLNELYRVARELGLVSLVEVHNEQEMSRCIRLSPQLIGINNRNLETFVTDLDVTGQLASRKPQESLLVSESGIFTAADVSRVHQLGADAILVGEAIMRETNIGDKVRELSQAVK